MTTTIDRVDRFDTLDVEGFMLSDPDSSMIATRHFECVPDLGMTVRKALGESGTEQAVIVIRLGLDDYDAHRVQLDYTPGECAQGAYGVVEQAIAALEVIRQRLAAMQGRAGRLGAAG